MKKFLLLTALSFASLLFAQQRTQPKMKVSTAAFFRLSPPLREMIDNAIYVPKNEKENKNELEFEPRFNGRPGPDPLSILQRNHRSPVAEPLNGIVNFDGVDNIDGVAPPDTQGDVSPNHYMQCVNNHTAIYDRDGNVVVNPFPTSDFWQGTPYDDRNDGDAVILWDEDAQRWLVTQFYVPDNGDQYLLIAVSQTDDPTGQYYQYAFQYQYMPDYPKWAIWPDAYYMGANAFDQTDNYRYKGTYVSAFERDKILAGDANAQVVTFGEDPNLWSIFPADADVFPADGTDCPFISDEVANTNGNDEVYIYNFHVDWNDTNNSSFQHEITLNVADYGLFNTDTEVPQQDVNQELDLLHSRIMYRPYYRHFNDHESLCMVRTVNDNGVSAIRWYEFRDSGNGWEIHQQGTYNPGDRLWRWMPSIAMNQNGDIAIAYSVSSDNIHPSIRATGRYANDQLGVMTMDETEFYTGQDSQDGVSRWGDYSMMSVDPVDNTSFWFTTEYTTGGWNWATKIIHFELPNQCVYPDNQAADFQANAQSETQIDLSWTRGDGDRVIILAKQDNAVDATPADGSNYTADAQFGSGDEIGNENYVVYDGTGTSVSITGLSSSTTYHFALYEYDDTDHCYLTPPATVSAGTYGIPDVETLPMLQVNDFDAQGQGNVINENGANVTERGLCWSTAINPTTADDHDSNGTGTGTYTIDLTGLDINQTYYVRAYATNSYGTAYGENVIFTTGCGGVVDYPYVQKFDAWTASNPGTDCTGDQAVTLEECWENNSGDDSDWDIIAGATGSSDTGPDDDLSGGGQYVYLEASNCFNKTAAILTPHFNFTNVNNPYMSFFVYMYGADMGSLNLSYTTDNGSNWDDVGTINGEQGDKWVKFTVNMSGLSGEADVQFKFTATTGDDYQSDIAIDNFILKDYTPDNGVYCASEGNMSYETAITSVNFNNLQNADGGKTAAYNDYTYINTAVQRSHSYDLSVNLDTDGDYTVYSKVWIDWNQDRDFDDAGEEYDLGLASNVDNGATSNSPLSIAVPADAAIGKTRMRVSARYADYAAACDIDYDGEVEDYSITVTDKCTDAAFWDGGHWYNTDNDVLQPADLNDKLLFVEEILITNGTNIEACGMRVSESNDVRITSGDYISLTNDLYNEAEFLIENGASLVQTADDAEIDGTGTFQINRESQNMDEETDYAFWASPVQNFSLGGILTNSWGYYSYNPSTQDWQAENVNTVMQAGVGYAVAAPVNHTNGTINVNFVNGNEAFYTGDISVPLTINGTGAQDDDDWNFVGNPYPSTIDFDALVNDNANIQGTYYLWTNCAGLDANGQHQDSGFIVYSVGGGSTSACNGSGPSADQYISVAQGFAVEANADGNLIFKNSHRRTNNSAFVNRPGNTENRVWLDFSNNTGFSQNLIGFFDGATDQKDRLYDAHSLDNASFALYSLIGNEKFTIQGLAQWNNTERIVPLGYTTEVNGSHQIALNRFEGVFEAGVNIYLEDSYNNIIHDLKNSPYVFTTSAGTFDDRFRLIFNGTTSETEPELIPEKINLITNDGIFKVISDKENIQQIKVYTIQGKEIGKYQVLQPVDVLEMNLQNIPRQLLLFKIWLQNGKTLVIKGIR